MHTTVPLLQKLPGDFPYPSHTLQPNNPATMKTDFVDKAKQPSSINIQSKGHEKLLNIIDELRSQGISRFIDLPQLCVCGDQSSGKSSVLEAVSGLQFPTKDALCTRFATELILRRSPEVTSNVSIIPDTSRSDAEKARIQSFKSEQSVFEDLGAIIDAAGKEMGLEGTQKVFSTDVLRIELTGPQQPHLTLVDLPGLFHAGNKLQSDADAEAVKGLVTSYMKKSRSIILAVVSAKNDYANQIVTRYARDFDPEGERTLAIITKPDTLPAGSDSEKQFFELAENKDVYFRLGWHVLKNRDYDQRSCSPAERDESENNFFSRGIWTSLSPTQLGIGALRPRLSRVLQGQILAELPSLIRDVEKALNDTQGRLDRLGKSRGTRDEQRLHLHAVSEAFSSIIKDATNGFYDNEYFGDVSSTTGYAKRTRAVVNNLLDKFAEDVRLKGHKWQVVAEVPATKSKAYPFKVSKDHRLEQVKELIRRNRGKELSSISKEENITVLFREQCSPWIGLVKKYTETIFEAVKASVMLALEATADQNTRDGILSYIINPAIDKLKTNLDTAVAKNLRQHVSSHPITFNHYFTENIQNLRNAHTRQHFAKLLTGFFGVNPLSEKSICHPGSVNTASLLQALTKPNEADVTKFACSEALHVMEAYYKVAMKYFVDDFAISSVEQALMADLTSLFSPTTVLMLDEELVEDIAGETEESQIERASSSSKLATLKQALDLLRRLDRGTSKVIKPTDCEVNGIDASDNESADTNNSLF